MAFRRDPILSSLTLPAKMRLENQGLMIEGIATRIDLGDS